MKTIIKVLPYRFRYYKKKIYNFIGICDKCKSSVNYTSTGRAICPHCNR